MTDTTKPALPPLPPLVEWNSSERRSIRELLDDYGRLCADEREAAVRASLEADAMRYRHVKNHAEVIFKEPVTWMTRGKDCNFKIHSTMPSRDELDIAVDAARAAGEVKS